MGRYHFHDDIVDETESPSCYNDNGSVSIEEGEIIEDDGSDIHAMDIDGDEDEDESYANDDQCRQDDRQRMRPPLSSYLPSFRARISSSRSRSFDSESIGNEERCWADHAESSNEHNTPQHYNDYVNEQKPGPVEEYRLIASTKYDRNYCDQDFYHRQSSNGHDSPTNTISEDELDEPNHSMDDRHRSCRHDELVVRSDPPASQLATNAPKPEIHYHIYVSEQQAARWFPQEENKNIAANENQQRPLLLWKWISILAFITHLLIYVGCRYNLLVVPPPPSYLTWEEYRNNQFKLVRRISREGYALCHHILSASNLVQSSGEDFLGVNIFEFPSKWSASSEHHRSNTFGLFGQEQALHSLRVGLDAWFWKTEKRDSKKDGVSHPRRDFKKLSVKTNNGALVIYASGGKGVGKRSLAKWILQHLLPSPISTNQTNALATCESHWQQSFEQLDDYTDTLNQYYCPLLHLNPSDYYHQEQIDEYDFPGTSTTDGHDQGSSHLYQRILDHVVAAGGGASVVLLDRVDCVPNSLGSCEFSNVETGPLWLPNLISKIRKEPTIFRNTVLLLTSHVGTTTAEKWRRKRLQSLNDGDATMVSELQSLVRYDVLRYHGCNDPSSVSQKGYDCGIEDWVIAPMARLERSTMASILNQIARGQTVKLSGLDMEVVEGTPQSLQLTESASNHILESLEWHQWIHKNTGDVLRIWSPEGATPLLDVWKTRILPSVLSFQRNGKACGIDDENSVRILDIEATSLEPRILLKSCLDSVDESNDHVDVITLDGRSWKCSHSPEQTCGFYL